MTAKYPRKPVSCSIGKGGLSRRSVVITILGVLGLVGAVAAGAMVISVLPSLGHGPAAQGPAVSPLPQPPTGWRALTSGEQAMLAPLEPSWVSLDASARSRWILVAHHLMGKSPQAVARAQSRMTTWQHLSAQERQRARSRFVLASRLPATEKMQRWRLYEAHVHPDAAHVDLASRDDGPAFRQVGHALDAIDQEIPK